MKAITNKHIPIQSFNTQEDNSTLLHCDDSDCVNLLSQSCKFKFWKDSRRLTVFLNVFGLNLLTAWILRWHFIHVCLNMTSSNPSVSCFFFYSGKSSGAACWPSWHTELYSEPLITCVFCKFFYPTPDLCANTTHCTNSQSHYACFDYVSHWKSDVNYTLKSLYQTKNCSFF